tara:strand:+ start:85 stop:354 length:270 start_codon:yes stop_codon:yes gene_type:complete
MKKIFFIAFFTLISFCSFANNQSQFLVVESSNAPSICVMTSKGGVCSEPLYSITLLYINKEGKSVIKKIRTRENHKIGDIINSDNVFLR